jgi:S1-C subfamily serine protease
MLPLAPSSSLLSRRRGFSVAPNGERRPGDLIVAVGGETVQGSEDVSAIVEQFSVGDQVPLTILRGSQRLVINVPLLESSEMQ